jgi:hypothetical protein
MAVEMYHRLYLQHPALFLIYEHILAAQLLIRYKMSIVESFFRDGLIRSTDAEEISERIFKPSLEALHTFLPSVTQVNNLTRNSGAKLWKKVRALHRMGLLKRMGKKMEKE